MLYGASLPALEVMSEFLITNARLFLPGEAPRAGSLLVEGTKIKAIDPIDAEIAEGTARVDAAGLLLTPGMVDLHTHGIHEFLYEQGADDIRNAAGSLARYGTTCVLPTLYRVLKPGMGDHLKQLTEALDSVQGVSMPGFHMEGPFLRLPGAGAETVDGDLELLEELLEACGDRVAAMSVSPDTPGIMPVIERLKSRGIPVFVTHTRASIGESLEAIEAGVRHGTHFYNVFPLPDEEEPGCRAVGLAEALLADPRCTVDFICDGIHVHPVAIKAALAAKGPAGVALITDSNIGAGLPPGIFHSSWKYPVKIAEGDAARVHLPGDSRHGLLAGSSLTMDKGVNNLLRWLDLPLQDVIAMATSTPAAIAGLEHKGKLAAGCDADLVLWKQTGDRCLAVQRTWSMGKLVYSAEG